VHQDGFYYIDIFIIFFFFLFFSLPWMLLFDFQEYRETYSECTQKYQFVSIKKISLGVFSVHETRDGALQTYSFFFLKKSWMKPHTNIIHIAMPFKRIFSADNKQRCFFETDAMATCSADLRPMSAPPATLLTAVRRCVHYPLRPASLCVWLCPKEQTSLLNVISVAFELWALFWSSARLVFM
jgi:hypothetical protein